VALFIHFQLIVAHRGYQWSAIDISSISDFFREKRNNAWAFLGKEEEFHETGNV